jgi:hypothetical protein
MSTKNDLITEQPEEKPAEPEYTPPMEPETPKKSMVQVRFLEENRTLTYYNDKFDLHCGDLVYVDGALAGCRGCIMKVNYNFKVKMSGYKRVVAKVDTAVRGQLYVTSSHFIAFDPSVLPAHKVLSWFLTEPSEDDEFACGSDGSSFQLDDLKGLDVTPEIEERGRQYYRSEWVRYLSMNGTQGYAIVEGDEPYEVEFEYNNGVISQLSCTCPCSYNCKHMVATMLLLREMLEQIESDYGEQFQQTGYFAAVYKDTFYSNVLKSKENGGLLLT